MEFFCYIKEVRAKIADTNSMHREVPVMKNVIGKILVMALLIMAVAVVGMAADPTVAFIRNTALTPTSDDLIVKELQGFG